MTKFRYTSVKRFVNYIPLQFTEMKFKTVYLQNILIKKPLGSGKGDGGTFRLITREVSSGWKTE